MVKDIFHDLEDISEVENREDIQKVNKERRFNEWKNEFLQRDSNQDSSDQDSLCNEFGIWPQKQYQKSNHEHNIQYEDLLTPCIENNSQGNYNFYAIQEAQNNNGLKQSNNDCFQRENYGVYQDNNKYADHQINQGFQQTSNYQLQFQLTDIYPQEYNNFTNNSSQSKTLSQNNNEFNSYSQDCTVGISTQSSSHLNTESAINMSDVKEITLSDKISIKCEKKISKSPKFVKQNSKKSSESDQSKKSSTKKLVSQNINIQHPTQIQPVNLRGNESSSNTSVEQTNHVNQNQLINLSENQDSSKTIIQQTAPNNQTEPTDLSDNDGENINNNVNNAFLNSQNNTKNDTHNHYRNTLRRLPIYIRDFSTNHWGIKNIKPSLQQELQSQGIENEKQIEEFIQNFKKRFKNIDLDTKKEFRQLLKIDPNLEGEEKLFRMWFREYAFQFFSDEVYIYIMKDNMRLPKETLYELLKKVQEYQKIILNP